MPKLKTSNQWISLAVMQLYSLKVIFPSSVFVFCSSYQVVLPSCKQRWHVPPSWGKWRFATASRTMFTEGCLRWCVYAVHGPLTEGLIWHQPRPPVCVIMCVCVGQATPFSRTDCFAGLWRWHLPPAKTDPLLTEDLLRTVSVCPGSAPIGRLPQAPPTFNTILRW